jgi:predicted DNA-binding transcriptional regulator YafY
MTIDAGERLRRVLSVMPLVVGRGNVSVEELRAHAGIDPLTLLDDLRALTERDDEPGGFVEAISILFDAESISVRSPHFGRPIRITLPELCALELGLAILGASSAPSERAIVDRARARVRAAIVAMPASAARDDLWYANGPALPDEGILELLNASLSRRNKVRISYRKAQSAESSERVVHPYAALPARGSWFLVAYCERSDAIRFFRIDRIESATLMDATFERRDDIDLDATLLPDRALVSPVTERLVVRYSPRIARWIAEREDGEGNADGSFTVSHPLADDDWAIRHVLQYGPEAEILEPKRLRVRVADTLRQMARDVA